jgi:hypothetical protein
MLALLLLLPPQLQAKEFGEAKERIAADHTRML